MTKQKQAVKFLRKTIKVRMLDRGETVRSIARTIRHDESVVSKAINHGQFPRVRAKILEALQNV